MKKGHSKAGTLNRLFGRKQGNSDSLYATNQSPPYILPQVSTGGVKNEYDGVLTSFSYGEESGTATLKARPRVRPLLPFSSSNSQEMHGLAVPTPSIPFAFVNHASLGNGSKVNGNYRMFSSVGDLRSISYSDGNVEEDIPPPPSMPPPPPPPNMAPPPPPLQSPSISSPASSSPPDFIPPTPGAPPSMSPLTFPAMAPPAPPPMAPPPPPPVAPPPPPLIVPPAPPAMAPPAPPLVAPPAPPTFAPPAAPTIAPCKKLPQAPQPPQNVSKWKSETGLNTLQSDAPQNSVNQTYSSAALPNPLLLKHKLNPDPHATLPRSFKVPPPAPARTSSIFPQERKDQSHDEADGEPKQTLPRSPIPSSFNPKAEAKLFFPAGPDKTALIEALNKRRSMIVMEDPDSPRPIPPPKTVAKNLPQPPQEMEKNKDFVKTKVLSTDVRTSKPVELHSTDENEFPDSNDGSAGEANRKQRSGVDTLTSKLASRVSDEGEELQKPPSRRHIVNFTKDSGNLSSDVQKSDGFKSTKFMGKSTSPLGGNEKISHDLPLKENTSEITIPSPPVQFMDRSQKPQKEVGKFKDELKSVLSNSRKDIQAPEGSVNATQGLDANKGSYNFGSSRANLGEPRVFKPTIKLPLLPLSRETEKKDGPSWKSESLSSNKIGDLVLPPPDYSPSGSNPASPSPTSLSETPVSSTVSLPAPTVVSPVPTQPQNPVEISSPQYKPHHGRQVSVSSLSSVTSFTPAHNEPASPNKSWDNVSASLEGSPSQPLASMAQTDQHESPEPMHPVTGEKVEARSPMALLLAAKERAEKSKLAKSKEHNIMPESPSTNKPETLSSSIIRYNSNPNSFVVMPKSLPTDAVVSDKKENTLAATHNGRMGAALEQQHADPKPVALNSPSDKLLNRLNWRNEESPAQRSATIRPVQGLVQLTNENSNSVSLLHLNDAPDDVQISSFTSPTPYTVSGNDRWRADEHPKFSTSPVQSLPQSTSVTYGNKTTDFQVSSLASPTRHSVVNDEDQDFHAEVIPPPPEFRNDHEAPSYLGSKAKQRDFPPSSDFPVHVQTFSIKNDSNSPRYDHSYALQTPPVSQTISSPRNYSSYTSTNSTILAGDPHKGSLIKKRLYMPEPASTQNYGRAPGASRFLPSTTHYNSNMGQYSSTQESDARRYNSVSRSSMQRRTSLDHTGRSMLPSSMVKEVTQIAQNRDYSYGTVTARGPHGKTSYQGMTFTVRPGTRQPISYTQQGGPR